MTENNEQLEPKIYIACLASYNAGVLHGEYVDATLEPDEIREEIQRVLESSPIKDADPSFVTTGNKEKFRQQEKRGNQID